MKESEIKRKALHVYNVLRNAEKPKGIDFYWAEFTRDFGACGYLFQDKTRVIEEEDGIDKFPSSYIIITNHELHDMDDAELSKLVLERMRGAIKSIENVGIHL